MKNLLIFLLLCVLFISCGEDGGDSKTPRPHIETKEQLGELSVEENAFKDLLLEKREMDQKELVQELLRFKGLSENGLKKIDQLINVECLETGLCNFTTKEIK